MNEGMGRSRRHRGPDSQAGAWGWQARVATQLSAPREREILHWSQSSARPRRVGAARVRISPAAISNTTWVVTRDYGTLRISALPRPRRAMDAFKDSGCVPDVIEDVPAAKAEVLSSRACHRCMHAAYSRA